MSSILAHGKKYDIETPLTKRAQAKGGKLHTWQRGLRMMGPVEGWFWYRCLICDYVSWAKGSRTPDPDLPCPVRERIT